MTGRGICAHCKLPLQGEVANCGVNVIHQRCRPAWERMRLSAKRIRRAMDAYKAATDKRESLERELLEEALEILKGAAR
jgi:hypothetical protein